jgi:Predicted kinase
MDWNAIDPRGSLDWDAIARAIPQSEAMKTCIQDPVFHAEGDVFEHTVRVTEELLADPEFGELDETSQRVLVLAAIFHDVAKPATRKEEFDPTLGRARVTHHGHSNMGARDAWLNLWKAGVPLDVRLRVFALIAWHQRPFHIFNQDDPRPELARFSAVGRWRELIMLARADNKGRIAPNTAETDETMQLLRLMCQEEGVLDTEWPFGNDAARTAICRKNSESLFFAPQEPAGSRVIVMSAPPGSGKDTYIAKQLSGLPIVSMDQIRIDMGIKASDEQGSVAQAAFEQARFHLRRQQPFVWNATGTSRLMRDKLIGLCLDYDAHVSIHALDCPYELMLKRNRDRRARVPEDAIDRMLLKWEPPLPGEAHAISWIDSRTFEPVLSHGDTDPQPAPMPIAPGAMG